MTAERPLHDRSMTDNRPHDALYPVGRRVSQSLQTERSDRVAPCTGSSGGLRGERRRCVSDVSVRVRISDFIGERRYAICVERPDTAAWVVDVDAARKLVRDLG